MSSIAFINRIKPKSFTESILQESYILLKANSHPLIIPKLPFIIQTPKLNKTRLTLQSTKEKQLLLSKNI